MIERLNGDLDQFVRRGDIDKFRRKIKNSNSIAFIFDADGILVNSPKEVTRRFRDKSGLYFHHSKLEFWDHLTMHTKRHEKLVCLDPVITAQADDDWYDPITLRKSPPYYYSRRVVQVAQGIVNTPNDIHVLTARRDYLMPATYDWLGQYIPEIPQENVLRSDEKHIDIARIANNHDWVIFIDDTDGHVSRAVNHVPNCLGINIPLGLVQSKLEHPNVIILDRFPQLAQDIYPLYKILSSVAQ